MKKTKNLFRMYCLLVVGTYALAQWRGWTIWPRTQRTVLPQGVRQAPGGYRSHVFWTGGK